MTNMEPGCHTRQVSHNYTKHRHTDGAVSYLPFTKRFKFCTVKIQVGTTGVLRTQKYYGSKLLFKSRPAHVSLIIVSEMVKEPKFGMQPEDESKCSMQKTSLEANNIVFFEKKKWLDTSLTKLINQEFSNLQHVILFWGPIHFITTANMRSIVKYLLLLYENRKIVKLLVSVNKMKNTHGYFQMHSL